MCQCAFCRIARWWLGDQIEPVETQASRNAEAAEWQPSLPPLAELPRIGDKVFVFGSSSWVADVLDSASGPYVKLFGSDPFLLLAGGKMKGWSDGLMWQWHTKQTG